jgi:Asparagine synthase
LEPQKRPWGFRWRSNASLCGNGHGVSKYLLSRAVRDAGYKVVYTGEGSDEIMYRLTLLARLRLENQVAVVTGGAATAIFCQSGPQPADGIGGAHTGNCTAMDCRAMPHRQVRTSG